jgi:hypothetical protein
LPASHIGEVAPGNRGFQRPPLVHIAANVERALQLGSNPDAFHVEELDEETGILDEVGLLSLRDMGTSVAEMNGCGRLCGLESNADPQPAKDGTAAQSREIFSNGFQPCPLAELRPERFTAR